MKKENVVIIGAAIVDVLVQGANPKAFETGSWPAQNIRMSIGGDGINEATVLGKLGVPVHLQTMLCDDEAGKIVREHCGKYGISVDGCAVQKEVPTGVNVVLVQENGERNFLTNPNSTLRKLTLEQISMPFLKDTKLLCFASIFVFPYLQNEEMAEIFAAAKAQKITVCADMTKCKNGERVKDIKEALSYIDYLFPNYEEAAMVTGKTDLEEMADEFLQAGVKNVVIKCGRQGCYIKNEKQSLKVPAVSGVTCVDTTGAGDCFAAGFLYGLWKDYEIQQCARLANACGALAVKTLGATEGITGLSQVEALKL